MVIQSDPRNTASRLSRQGSQGELSRPGFAAELAGGGLEDEIRMLRLAIRRTLEMGASCETLEDAIRVLNALGLASSRLARLLAAQKELQGGGIDALTFIMDAVEEAAREMHFPGYEELDADSAADFELAGEHGSQAGAAPAEDMTSTKNTVPAENTASAENYGLAELSALNEALDTTDEKIAPGDQITPARLLSSKPPSIEKGQDCDAEPGTAELILGSAKRRAEFQDGEGDSWVGGWGSNGT